MAESPRERGSPSAQNRRADPRYVGKDLGTQCAPAGERWERPRFWPSSTPIHNATTFVYDRAEDLDDGVWRRTPGYSYSRAGSPTTSALERALSTLEGVDVTRVCGSGMAASHLAVLAAGAGKTLRGDAVVRRDRLRHGEGAPVPGRPPAGPVGRSATSTPSW